jgi:hypothetical protein
MPEVWRQREKSLLLQGIEREESLLLQGIEREESLLLQGIEREESLLLQGIEREEFLLLQGIEREESLLLQGIETWPLLSYLVNLLTGLSQMTFGFFVEVKVYLRIWCETIRFCVQATVQKFNILFVRFNVDLC